MVALIRNIDWAKVLRQIARFYKWLNEIQPGKQYAHRRWILSIYVGALLFLVGAGFMISPEDSPGVAGILILIGLAIIIGGGVMFYGGLEICAIGLIYFLGWFSWPACAYLIVCLVLQQLTLHKNGIIASTIQETVPAMSLGLGCLTSLMICLNLSVVMRPISPEALTPKIVTLDTTLMEIAARGKVLYNPPVLWLIIVLTLLLILAHIFESRRVIQRFRVIRKWISFIYVTLLTITSFTLLVPLSLDSVNDQNEKNLIARFELVNREAPEAKAWLLSAQWVKLQFEHYNRSDSSNFRAAIKAFMDSVRIYPRWLLENDKVKNEIKRQAHLAGERVAEESSGIQDYGNAIPANHPNDVKLTNSDEYRNLNDRIRNTAELSTSWNHDASQDLLAGEEAFVAIVGDATPEVSGIYEALYDGFVEKLASGFFQKMVSRSRDFTPVFDQWARELSRIRRDLLGRTDVIKQAVSQSTRIMRVRVEEIKSGQLKFRNEGLQNDGRGPKTPGGIRERPGPRVPDIHDIPR